MEEQSGECPLANQSDLSEGEAPKAVFMPELRPDPPQSFGYKCAWIAVRSDSAAAVAEALDLADVGPSTWARGVDAAYAGAVFVTPPLRGWVLAASSALPSNETHADELTPQLVWLARRFPDVQCFGTHRVVEAHLWARIVNGAFVRKFSYVGDQGIVLWDEGAPTPEEEALGMAFSRESAEEGEVPTEEDVMALAGRWSVDPSRLEEEGLPLSLGLAGLMPK
jgi:hypothetical protein